MGHGRILFFVLLGCLLFCQKTLKAGPPFDKEAQLDEAKQLNEQVAKLFQAGQYAEAIPPCEKALAIREEVLGSRHPDVATSLNMLANVHRAMGQYAKAERLYQQALAIRKEALGSRHPDVAKSLNNLALLYDDMDQYSRAERLYQESLAIFKETLGPRHPNVAQTLNNLAVLYNDIGLYGKAESLHKQGLAIEKEMLGPRDLRVADSLNNLAILYHDMGLYDKAEPLYKEALAIRKEALGSGHLKVAGSLNNLAKLYRDMDLYGKAEPLFEEALAIFKEALGPRHSDVARSLKNLAELYQDTGRYGKAEKLFQKALAIRKDALGAWHLDVAGSVHGLALLHLALGQPEAAMPLLKQGIGIWEHFLGTMSTESRLVSLLQRQRDEEEDVYSLLAQGKGRPVAQRLALSVALLRKGRSAAEGIQTQRAIQQALKDPQDRALFDRLTSARSQLARLYLKDPSGLPNYQKTVAALEIEADGLEQNLARGSATFRTRQFPGPEEVLARVAQAMPRDAALVEWLAFKPHNFSAKGKEPRRGAMRYLALVLFRDQHIRVVDLGEARPIDDAIQAFLNLLSQQRPGFLPAAQKLHSLVITPLQQALEGRTNLFIAPDGPLKLKPVSEPKVPRSDGG